MSVKPILFSGPMIRALLEGRKTQTRRVITPHNAPARMLFFNNWADCFILDPGNAGWRQEAHGFAVGDLLWVREAWKTHSTFEGVAPCSIPRSKIFYLSDGGYSPSGSRGRPSIHMPRWASRLTLEVTDVRVQRLQEISEADVRAEGAPDDKILAFDDDAGHGEFWPEYRDWFADLWDSLNAERGFGWDVNPWVVAITFTVHRQNVDALLAARSIGKE